MKKSKAFTLIELISVLVILSILALIVTPLVLNIIKKARTAADKRSVDAYGRSIELAVASYLLDNGTFPTSIEQLTIEYTRDRVECETTKLNSDSSVYLAGCKVNNRTVEGYTYGKEQTVTYKAYSVGDEVTYNNENYYVIKDSGALESNVTLLKAEPIKSAEISPYLTSTEVANKVKINGEYAKMPYYSSENCLSGGDVSGCSIDYEVSDIKQVVDIWKIKYAPGVMEARLIKKEEIDNSFEVEEYDPCGGCGIKWDRIKTNWMYNSNYSYWTMSPKNDSLNYVWIVGDDGGLSGGLIHMGGTVPEGDTGCTVRPVIVLNKSFIED